MHPLQVLVEPHNSLAERLLLSPLLSLVAQVGANGKAVRHTAEQVDLPRLTSLYQRFLGFMTELRREDRVGFCHADGAISSRFVETSQEHLRAAAIEKGPWMAPNSSWVINEG